MNADQSKALRVPFAEESISVLPKVNCKACTDAREKVCDRHIKKRCNVCGSWITEAHIHLSYVGHAETTDRFLEVDREWTWEPLAFDQQGLPAFDGNGGLWMRVTIAGVTRLGYGDAQGKKGPNAVKEAIGDGLRNAGMRFGVALSLWAKSDLDALHADKETGAIAGEPPKPAGPSSSPPATNGDDGAPGPDDIQAVRAAIWVKSQARGWDKKALAQDFTDETDSDITKASVEELVAYATKLEQRTNGAAQ